MARGARTGGVLVAVLALLAVVALFIAAMILRIGPQCRRGSSAKCSIRRRPQGSRDSASFEYRSRGAPIEAPPVRW